MPRIDNHIITGSEIHTDALPTYGKAISVKRYTLNNGSLYLYKGNGMLAL